MYVIYCSTLNEIIINYYYLKKTILDQSNLSSYRPIFQLSSISKTPEQVVSAQLINYSMYNTIVDKYQSAYLPHYSIETALTLIINDILIYLDNIAPYYIYIYISY